MNWSFWTRTRHADSNIANSHILDSLPTGLDSCDALDPLLSLYADHMASPEEARRVEAHLLDCEACRESAQWMQATHRALASRPTILPPADLHAQIARAIAASPSVSVRPVRAFSLRPAYAAAASLTAVGAILAGHVLLTARSVAPRPAKPPQVAELPREVPATPSVIPPVTPPRFFKPSSHPGIKPLPQPSARVAVIPDDIAASNAPQVRKLSPKPVREPLPKPVREPLPAPVITQKSLPVKLPALHKPSGFVLAKLPTKPVEHTHFVPQPIEKKPDVAVMATAPPAISIGAPSVTPQEAPRPLEASAHTGEGHFQTASLLSSVQDYARKNQSSLERNLSRAGSTAIRGTVRTTAMTTGLDSPTAYIDGIHTP